MISISEPFSSMLLLGLCVSSEIAIIATVAITLTRRKLDRYRIKYGFDDAIESINYSGKKKIKPKTYETIRRHFEKRRLNIKL